MSADVGDGAMVIPYERLSPEALRGVIEEFVTRDGTDLDDAEVKVAQVMEQLRRGTVVITFDERTRTCNLVPAGPPDSRHGDGARRGPPGGPRQTGADR